MLSKEKMNEILEVFEEELIDYFNLGSDTPRLYMEDEDTIFFCDPMYTWVRLKLTERDKIDEKSFTKAAFRLVVGFYFFNNDDIPYYFHITVE